MQARIMLPGRNMAPSMIGNNADLGGYGSSSNLSLSQNNVFQSHLMDEHQLLQMDMSNHQGTSDQGEFARLDEFGSGSENHEEGREGSGDDQQQQGGAGAKRKKRYHRHTQIQIQEMEAFFKECPHPDDKQRKELSRQLGLEPLQVKFWFQNKRTQMKTQHERYENSNLRAENEKLRGENMRYREALSNSSCPTCGGPAAAGELSYEEHQLRIDNARLREEIDRLAAIAAKYVGKGVMNYPMLPSPVPPRPLEFGVGGLGGDLFGGSGNLLKSISGPTEADKPMIIELAVAAMEELVRMAQLDEPLWTVKLDGSNTAVLDEDEYIRTFPRGIGPKPPGFKCEASRENAVVIMNHISLVEILMDVDQWTTVFTGIVSRAVTLDVLSTGVAGNYNGALQVMTAELQVPTPLIPTRESYFVRYCKQHGEGIWAVVDVSLDNLRPNMTTSCRRRPSGCLIQEMPNGYSKVVWVEHVEVDDRGTHSLYKQLVSTGHAFGAKRWIATLDRQCERLASVMATYIPNADVGVITNQEGRKSMLKLAERMVISFCAGVSGSTAHTWTTLSGTGADDVRVMTRKSVDDPGRPPGIVLSAATSFWLPISPKTVFDFLRDENSRSEWDILSNGGAVQEMAHIANGRDTGNCVSLLRVNSTNTSQSNMLILQESLTDPTGSFVIYAPVDIVSMNEVLTEGRNPDYVALLPSGFAILPDGSGTHGTELGPTGSLLTVAFQILVDTVPTAKLSLGSIATVNSLIGCTVERIRASLVGESPN